MREFLKENMVTKEEMRSEFIDVRAKMADMQISVNRELVDICTKMADMESSLQASINVVDQKVDVLGVKVNSLFRDMNALAGDVVEIKLHYNPREKKKVKQP